MSLLKNLGSAVALSIVLTSSALALEAKSGGGGGSAGSALTPITTVNFASSPYTVQASDVLLAIDMTGGSITINLPAATGSGRLLSFLRVDGTAANIATITRAGGDTISGQTNITFGGASGTAGQYMFLQLIDYASGKWANNIVPQGNNATLTSIWGGNQHITIAPAGVFTAATTGITTGNNASIVPGFNGLLQITPNALANFPTCAAGTEGGMATQTNSTAACSAGATATSAGTTHCQIYCNGTNWIQTGL